MCFYVIPGFSQSNLEHKEASQPPLVIVLAVTVSLTLFAFIIFVAKKLSSVKTDQVSCIYLALLDLFVTLQTNFKIRNLKVDIFDNSMFDWVLNKMFKLLNLT